MREPAAIATPLPKDATSPAISVREVSKAFRMPRHRAWTLKERMRHPLKSFGHDRLEALHDVSFEVAPGEFFAVIGRNGSGKSTLLRCIAGIYELDGGEIDVRGRIAPFIELGVGFQPQLAAPDNVTMAGTMMGLRPAEARRRVPSVIEFAELEEFTEMPVTNYSSGMRVRLAFSTSFQVDADVLLFDEVLAVGDALFQRKCKRAFEALIAAGRTSIYVSHNLDTIKRFADRALLLDEGRMVALGEPEEVIEEYERLNSAYEQARARTGGGAAAADAVTLGDLTVPGTGESGGEGGRATGLRRFADVCLSLSRTDFKLRYLDSFVGYAWALAQPLLMFAVLYTIWTEVLQTRAASTPDYGLKLLLGISMFTFFTEAAGHAMTSLVHRGGMLRQIRFPPTALPLASVLTSSYVYGLSLAVVFGFILASGIAPEPAWLQMIPLLALLLVFTAGVSMLLSLIYVQVRDVQQIWVVVARLLFFATPVFYPIAIVPDDIRQILMLNPLAVVIVQAQHVLIDPAAPSAAEAAGDLQVAIVAACAVATAAAGAWLYGQRARRMIERA